VSDRELKPLSVKPRDQPLVSELIEDANGKLFGSTLNNQDCTDCLLIVSMNLLTLCDPDDKILR